MTRVIIPKRNEKDLEEIPKELRAKIVVQPVEHMDEIWPLACSRPEPLDAGS